MDDQTSKLKKRSRHQKTNQNNSRIRLPQEFFDNYASFCTNDTKSSLLFFPSSSSSSSAFACFFFFFFLRLVRSGAGQSFFSFFFGWAEKSPKMTQFSENEIFSVTNSVLFGKNKKKLRLK
jgi:hypothetical protein